jgi:hypothetical protein
MVETRQRPLPGVRLEPVVAAVRPHSRRHGLALRGLRHLGRRMTE